MAELQFTDQNFVSEVLTSNVPVLVDCWAPWCGPCRVLGPIISDVAKEMEGQQVKVGKLNVDENTTTAQQYQIMGIPTLLFFKGGQVAAQMVGVQPKEKIKEKLTSLMS